MHLCYRLTTTQGLTSGRCGVSALQNDDAVASTPPVPAAPRTRYKSLQEGTHAVNAIAPAESVDKGCSMHVEADTRGAHLALQCMEVHAMGLHAPCAAADPEPSSASCMQAKCAAAPYAST